MRALWLTAALLVGCSETSAPPAVPANVAPVGPSPLTLVVSNQSFEDEVVRIRVTVDGAEVVEADFEVLNQHQYYWFPVEVAAGQRRLRVEAEEVTEASVVAVGDAPTWAVIDHWGAGADRSLNVRQYDHAPLFG